MEWATYELYPQNRRFVRMSWNASESLCERIQLGAGPFKGPKTVSQLNMNYSQQLQKWTHDNEISTLHQSFFMVFQGNSVHMVQKRVPLHPNWPGFVVKHQTLIGTVPSINLTMLQFWLQPIQPHVLLLSFMRASRKLCSKSMLTLPPSQSRNSYSVFVWQLGTPKCCGSSAFSSLKFSFGGYTPFSDRPYLTSDILWSTPIILSHLAEQPMFLQILSHLGEYNYGGVRFVLGGTSPVLLPPIFFHRDFSTK